MGCVCKLHLTASPPVKIIVRVPELLLINNLVVLVTGQYCLARSAYLPDGLYILLALISFFFYLFKKLVLMIAQRTIISGCAGLILAIFSLNYY